jgi:hypothetical protein
MPTPQFTPLVCNQTYCGTGYFDGSIRDTDWYAYVATENDTMTWTVQAEFDVVIGLVETVPPGSDDCANSTGYLNPYAVAGPCTEISVTVPVTAGGTYWFFVAPQFSDVFTCDSPFIDYIATLTGLSCGCGDLDGDNDCDLDDYWWFLDAFGTCLGDDKYLPEADFDGDNCITLVDYQAWVVCYREANPGGKVPLLNTGVKVKSKSGGQAEGRGRAPMP